MVRNGVAKVEMAKDMMYLLGKMQKKVVTNISRSPPPHDWIKFNFNSASKNNLGLAELEDYVEMLMGNGSMASCAIWGNATCLWLFVL